MKALPTTIRDICQASPSDNEGRIVDAAALYAFEPCKWFGYRYISDEMITKYLDTRDFFCEVSHRPNTYTHRGIVWADLTDEDEAQRIALLIHLIRSGVKLDAVDIFYENKEGTQIEIGEGHHRCRAYLYLKKPIPIRLYD